MKETSPIPVPSKPPSLKNVISKYKLSAKKSLGQHFLLDENLTDRIAKAANVRDAPVVEIGPGPGGLTRSIIKEGAKTVLAIEKDYKCILALRELTRFYPNKIVLIQADILKLTLSNILQEPSIIVSNLPYNISSRLLIKLLQQLKLVRNMTLTFQKEVAERLVATPSSKSYGRLSVMTQWLCETKIQFHINKNSFIPAPKITSSVVNFKPRKKPLSIARWECLEKVTRTAFNQRRKMLRSSLGIYNIDFSDLEIDSTRRAEDLSIEEFCKLARAIEKLN